MSILFWKAYSNLIRFDLYLARRDFAGLYERVGSQPIAQSLVPRFTVDQICSVVDTACIWYWREVLCLQRSAATASLLRSYGISAQLVIGAQQLPFKAHAWVEVEGRVVNDKPYTNEVYAVLDRS